MLYGEFGDLLHDSCWSWVSPCLAIIGGECEVTQETAATSQGLVGGLCGLLHCTTGHSQTWALEGMAERSTECCAFVCGVSTCCVLGNAVGSPSASLPHFILPTRGEAAAVASSLL
jgi:hypothetical protein